MVNTELISKIINNLDLSKTTRQDDIPTKVIKDSKDLFSYVITVSLNHTVKESAFPEELKRGKTQAV